MTPPLYSQLKRKHSAIHCGSDTSSLRSDSPVIKKRHRSVDALMMLGERILALGDQMSSAVTRVSAPLPTAIEQAALRAQEIETDLDNSSLSLLLRYFLSNPDAARVYNLLTRDGLRQTWVQNVIEEMKSRVSTHM